MRIVHIYKIMKNIGAFNQSLREEKKRGGKAEERHIQGETLTKRTSKAWAEARR